MKEGFFHCPEFNRYGNGITFGFSHDDKNLIIAKSMCSKNDQYSKRIGRAKCREQIEAGTNVVGWCKTFTLADIKSNMICDENLGVLFPLLTIKGAQKAVNSIKTIDDISKNAIYLLCLEHLDGKGEFMK